MSEGYSHLRDSARYKANTLIGNWNEDRELQRSILKDLLAKKGTGTLKLDAFQQKMATALSEVELTKVRDDPYVHFGDVLQVVHLESGSVLACDVSDQDTRPGEEACAATGAPQNRSPCARNTMLIVKYRPSKSAPFESDYGDDIIRYGMKVQVVAHPLATNQDVDSEGGPRRLCLFSKPPSVTHFAKYSRQQLVGFTFRADSFDTVWQVVTPDPTQRTVSEGVEVIAGAPVLLVHAATQKPLLLEKQKYPNDFGNEWELTAKASTSQGMKLAMEQTAKGVLKGSLPKGETTENFWTFSVGTRIGKLPAPRSTESEAVSLLGSLVTELGSRGDALPMLERKLVVHMNKALELPADELLLLLRQVGSVIPEAEVHFLAQHFKTHKPGIIDGGALLQLLRRVWGGSSGTA